MRVSSIICISTDSISWYMWVTKVTMVSYFLSNKESHIHHYHSLPHSYHKMKSEKMLDTFIHQLQLTKKAMTTIQHKIKQDYDVSQQIMESQPTTPHYMNYIFSKNLLHDSKKSNTNRVDSTCRRMWQNSSLHTKR